MHTLAAEIIVMKIRSCKKKVTKISVELEKKVGAWHTLVHIARTTVRSEAEQHKGRSIYLGGIKELLLNKMTMELKRAEWER